MFIPFVVPEILGGWNLLPDAIKLSEKADAINRYYGKYQSISNFFKKTNDIRDLVTCRFANYLS